MAARHELGTPVAQRDPVRATINSALSDHPAFRPQASDPEPRNPVDSHGHAAKNEPFGEDGNVRHNFQVWLVNHSSGDVTRQQQNSRTNHHGTAQGTL